MELDVWLVVIAPAVTAFGGAILGMWLRGRQDSKARREDELASWRQAVVLELPPVEQALDKMDGLVARVRDGYAEREWVIDDLRDTARALEEFRPLMFRLGGMHPDGEVREAARSLDRSMVLMPLRISAANHPSRVNLTGPAEEAISGCEADYLRLLDALRG